VENQNVKRLHALAPGIEGIPVEVRDEILRAVAGIRYGSVEVVVHGAKVVQIESREKVRIGDTKPQG
jgi:hypothetical protein